MTATARITKRLGYFPAKHRLVNHDGLCANDHGHNYEVEVECQGPISDQAGASDEGMVVDFQVITAAWHGIRALLDHQDLNTALADGGPAAQWYGPITGPTTAENIARWMLGAFRQLNVPATAVTVWETPTSSATVTWEGS